MPVAGDCLGDFVFFVGGTIYGSICMVIAPLWIRNYRLKECRRLLSHHRNLTKTAKYLPQYYRLNVQPLLNTFADVESRIEGKEGGVKGFLDHGLYRGWIDVTRGHYAMKSEATALKAKLFLNETEEKWRLKKVMERIQRNAPKEDFLEEEDSPSRDYLHVHHEYFDEISNLVNTNTLRTTDSGRTEQIARLYVVHEKMAKTEKKVDEEFLDSFTNWLVLLEMTEHLAHMQQEVHAYELDHGNVFSEWADQRHKDGREDKRITSSEYWK